MKIEISNKIFWFYLLICHCCFKQYSNILRNVNCKSPQWEVEGYDFSTRRCFKYICHKVVLATGTSDAHKMIDVDGELNNPDWVFHDLKQFETAVMELKKNQCVKGYFAIVI